MEDNLMLENTLFVWSKDYFVMLIICTYTYIVYHKVGQNDILGL